MRIISLLALSAAGLASAAGPSAQSASEETLRIHVIDVEGGEATLFVGPSGESLLVDAGWPGFGGATPTASRRRPGRPA